MHLFATPNYPHLFSNIWVFYGRHTE